MTTVNEQDPRHRAIDAAYREHADDVYRVAYAILRDQEAAVDATHDCFARAFERWEQYDDHRPLRAWLHGIVSHAALDAVRHRRVRRLAAPAIADLGSGGSRASGRTDDPATAIVDRDAIETGLATLKPDARAALILRHYYGYDYAEIGGFLGMSAGNVGSILSRANATLRLRLDPDADALVRETPTRAAR